MRYGFPVFRKRKMEAREFGNAKQGEDCCCCIRGGSIKQKTLSVWGFGGVSLEDFVCETMYLSC